ncbi:hypothetical protein D3C79_1079840 [compost metagenome]
MQMDVDQAGNHIFPVPFDNFSSLERLQTTLTDIHKLTAKYSYITFFERLVVTVIHLNL